MMFICRQRAEHERVESGFFLANHKQCETSGLLPDTWKLVSVF
jgi:hypothetical protein